MKQREPKPPLTLEELRALEAWCLQGLAWAHLPKILRAIRELLWLKTQTGLAERWSDSADRNKKEQS